MQPLTSSSDGTDQAIEGDGCELTNSQYQEIQTLQDALNLAQQLFSLTEDPSYEKESIPLPPPPHAKPDPFTPLCTVQQSSLMSKDSVLKAKECIQKVAKKCTIEDTLMDIHK